MSKAIYKRRMDLEKETGNQFNYEEITVELDTNDSEEVRMMVKSLVMESRQIVSECTTKAILKARKGVK